MRSLTILAPAKVNLILKVLGRRLDSYHELFTLFHRISLCDRLTLRKIDRPKFHLIVKGARLGPLRQNLIYRAYRLLRKLVRVNEGVEVVLEKKIPHGAGLGGGSSDAAHFILGMIRLLKLKLPRRTLLKLCRQLGSDVPFFFSGVNQAIGTGRGDQIKAVPSKNKYWFVLVVPTFRIKTSLVYNKFDSQSLTRISRAVTITSVLSNSKKKTWPFGLLHNDLYPASCTVRPELERFADAFNDLGVEHWLMSGSGSTMFSVHKSRREAEKIAELLRRRKSKASVFICHTY